MNLIALASVAQTSIKGVVTDKTDNSAVRGSTVSLLLQLDSSLVKNTISDSLGRFQFDNVPNDSFIVTVNTLNYQQYVSFFTINNAEKDLGTIRLDRQGKDLSVVTVVAKASPVIQKGDTSQFSASQYKVNPDATTEDLIKKMPGITVDKDGTVTAQGETVRKVTIDGKDFFGDDASAALKNLPSEVVDKIQVFDRLSDQAQLTGFDDGNSQKAINIVTKSGIKNGQFGRIYGGYGTDERYTAGGNVSFFKGDRRLSLVGNFNNINQQNFGAQDLLGITSSGNNRGGGGGGGGPRGGGGPGGGGPGGNWGGGSNNFTVGQASGISRTNAFGINYANLYGKMSFAGSYFYNNSRNTNQSFTNYQTIGLDTNQLSKQAYNAVTDNFNHRANFRMEFKFDSSNTLFIIPSINYQKNNSNSITDSKVYNSLGDSLSNSIARNMAERDGYNIRNNIMFRHAFPKKGRSLSLGVNMSLNKNNSESVVDAAYRFFRDGVFASDSLQNILYDNQTDGQTFGGTIAYTEPIGKFGQLQFDYNPSIQKNKTEQLTYEFDGQKYADFNTQLSNKFDNTVITNNGGISYRFSRNRDEQLSFGVNLQNAQLESERQFPVVSSVDQSFTNLLPNFMWRKKLSPSSNIRVFYRASTSFPSVTQLQDVVNNTNPLRVTIGNPDLEQSYGHFLSGRYTYTNSKTSRSFFANIFMQTTSNYITNSIYLNQRGDSLLQGNIPLPAGSQLTRPVNLDGYKNFRSFFTFSTPLKAIKTTVNLNAGLGFSKLPGLYNNQKTNTDNLTYNAGVVFASNISEYVDFNLSYNANFNDTRTKSPMNNGGIAITKTSFVNQVAGLQLNLLNKKGWFIQNDLSGNSYKGLNDLDQNFLLWNAAIGKKFLKNKSGELKLSVFDLLKQNQSISRTITGNYIEDVQTNVLQQYFMLTFTYSLKNFGTARQTNQNRGNRQQQNSNARPAGGGSF